jgi:hypothetical protein
MKKHLFFFSLISSACFAQNFQWATKAGGSNIDIGYAIDHDGAGNSYITGSYQGTAVFGQTILAGNTFPYSNVFVAKVNSIGGIVWAKKGGGNRSDAGYAIATDAAGNSYVSGYFNDTATFGSFTLISGGMEDVFVVKYDPSGNELWAKRFGNTGSEYGYGISIDGAGNCYVTDNIFMITKYNTNGNLQWTFTVSGQRTIHGIKTDNAGNSYITGSYTNTLYVGTYTLANSGGTDIFIAKISATGSVLWAGRMGGTGDDDGRGIALDGQNNMYVTGFMNDPNGQAFISKLNANGNPSWTRTATGSNAGWHIATDLGGNSFITGSISNGALSFGSFNLTADDTKEIFIANYDSAGTCQWAMNTGGTSFSEGYGITTDDQCNAFVTGYFQTDAAFGTNALSAPGANSQVFVAMADSNCLTGIHHPDDGSFFSVFPNPSTGIFSVTFRNDARVFVYDAMGNEIYHAPVLNGKLSLDLSSQPKGIYLVKVVGGEKIMIRKILLIQ